MIKDIQTSLIIFGVLLLSGVGCRKQDSCVGQPGHANQAEVKIFSASHEGFDEGEFFLNGTFIVIRSDEFVGNYSRSIVVLRQIGSSETLLLSVCTTDRLRQDDEYALTGWARNSTTCPGIEMVGTKDKPGAILTGIKNCSAGPNMSAVFLVAERDNIADKCERFSLASENRLTQGSCGVESEKRLMFDVLGLSKCGKIINPEPEPRAGIPNNQ